MCVAVVAIGASVAATAYAAHEQSQAVQNASDTQAKAGQQALTAQQQAFQQEQKNFAPYAAAGQSALGRLQATAGTYRGGMPPGGPGAGQPMPGMSAPPGMSPPMPSNGVGTGMPPMQALGNYGPPTSQGTGQAPPMSGAPGGSVLMRAPTGETQRVAPQDVQKAQQMGAMIVPG